MLSCPPDAAPATPPPPRHPRSAQWPRYYAQCPRTGHVFELCRGIFAANTTLPALAADLCRGWRVWEERALRTDHRIGGVVPCTRSPAFD